jgi:acyl-CoA reductase-like NAD-dependent aldehyde dehydrogenase
MAAEDGVTQGPLIDDAAIAKVEELVADALAPRALVSSVAASPTASARPTTSRRSSLA